MSLAIKQQQQHFHQDYTIYTSSRCSSPPCSIYNQSLTVSQQQQQQPPPVTYYVPSSTAATTTMGKIITNPCSSIITQPPPPLLAAAMGRGGAEQVTVTNKVPSNLHFYVVFFSSFHFTSHRVQHDVGDKRFFFMLLACIHYMETAPIDNL